MEGKKAMEILERMQSRMNDRPSHQYSLGMLIGRLDDANPYREVRFDFGDMRPTGFESWRGVYGHLAITFDEGVGVTVLELKKMAMEANGGVFEGYKGGEYVMSGSTPLWVSSYGNASSTIIHDVTDDGYTMRLHTMWRELF